MTKKELLEAIKDMPDNATIEYYSYEILGGYAKVHDIEFCESDNTINLYS